MTTFVIHLECWFWRRSTMLHKKVLLLLWWGWGLLDRPNHHFIVEINLWLEFYWWDYFSGYLVDFILRNDFIFFNSIQIGVLTNDSIWIIVKCILLIVKLHFVTLVSVHPRIIFLRITLITWHLFNWNFIKFFE